MTSAPGHSLLLKLNVLLETLLALKLLTVMVLQVLPCLILTTDGTCVFLLMVVYLSVTERFWLFATRCIAVSDGLTIACDINYRKNLWG